MDQIFDVVVIGAGVNGSSAAYSLSKYENKRILLLEQFPVPHTRGSSHGQSRIIRCLYTDKIYSQMTHDAFQIWREVEKDIGETLFIRNGMLEVTSYQDRIERCLSTLDSVGVPYERMSAEELNKRFPLFNVSESFTGIFEPNGGMLLASKCVAALQKSFKDNGGVFVDSEPVEEIIPGEIVTIKTLNNIYKAKSIIITAGSFTSKLTNQVGLNLPLRVERTHPLYWKLDDPLSGTIDKFPSFVLTDSILQHDIYGLAAYEYPGFIKICDHHGPEVQANKPDADPILTNVREIIRRYMRGMEKEEPSIIETCLYTITPDHHFIIDRHPVFKNIVIGAGFSGHGFKMAPVTGNVLATLALGEDPSYDLSMFRIKRFDNVVKKDSKL